MRVSKGKEGMLKVRKNGNEVVIGQHIRVKVIKNKTAPPFREGEFKIYFDGHEIDECEELANIALANGIIPRYSASGELSKTGRFYKWADEPEFLAKSKAEVAGQLRAFPSVKAAILQKIADGDFDEVDPEEVDDEDNDGDLDDDQFEELVARDAKNASLEAEEIE